MLNLLIVDDEKRTRDGLKMCLPWSEFGIGEIREADDGHTALEVALAFKPDIILSDIRMPTMTGIELARRVQAELPRCKFVFISGYADKEYLKAAIQLKAVSFIEKPISVAELKGCIGSVTDACRQEAEQHQRLADSAAKLESSIGMLQRDYAVQLAQGSPDADYMGLLLAESSFRLPSDGNYVSVLFHLHSALGPDSPPEHAAALRASLDAALANEFGRQRITTYVAGTIDGTRLVAHLQLTPSLSLNDLRASADRIEADFAGRCGKSSGHQLFAGIGLPVRGTAQLHRSYQTALTAVRQVFFLGSSRTAIFEEQPAGGAALPSDRLMREFGPLVHSCDHAVFPFIAALARDIRGHAVVSVDDVKMLFYKLLLLLYDEAHNKFLGRYMEDRKEEYLWHRVADSGTLQELLTFLESEVRAYLVAVASVGVQSRVVHETIRYIERHYQSGGFTISDIASYLQLTPAYLSQIFKKDTGQTINDYMNAYKVERAKELLAGRGVKLVEVAALSGYNDAKYFTKTFKRITGITPSEYRENALK
ncbi:response regulator [Paenibacillus albus]|uniref:response regulator n=1 Tax=Paenibacillus albus TaxID=2495582 RepID=UPI0013E012A5|nr:response regulator [Paenibacillus albus]